jgi:drug/metabolite transporter (DMT)-like permease
MVKEAVAVFPVLAFLTIRFAVASVGLLPLAFWSECRPGAERPDSVPHPAPHRTLAAGGWMGLALAAGYALQTFGLRSTTPAKAAFITGLAVVIVPVLAAVVLRYPQDRAVWLGVGLATTGLALLTLNRGLVPQRGDGLVFLCAAAFAVQLLVTGHLAPGHPPLTLTLGQLVTVTALCGLASLLVDAPWPQPDRQVVFAAVFTGLVATSVALTVQTMAQRVTSPSHTALIFSTEPVFGALFSYLLIGEVLTPRALAGCGLILAGMLLAEARRT